MEIGIDAGTFWRRSVRSRFDANHRHQGRFCRNFQRLHARTDDDVGSAQIQSLGEKRYGDPLPVLIEKPEVLRTLPRPEYDPGKVPQRVGCGSSGMRYPRRPAQAKHRASQNEN